MNFTIIRKYEPRSSAYYIRKNYRQVIRWHIRLNKALGISAAELKKELNKTRYGR